MYDVEWLHRVAAEYRHLRVPGSIPAQARGQRFNELVADVLRCWGIRAETSIRTSGEMDVGFAVDGIRYVMEVKWETKPADTGRIAKLQKRVRQRMLGTYGIFLSMSGYSRPALADVADGERLEVLLLDADHFEAMIFGEVPPSQLVTLLHDHAAFRGQAYTPMAELRAALRSTSQPALTASPSGSSTVFDQESPPAPIDSGGNAAMFAFSGRQTVYWILTALGSLLATLLALLTLVPSGLSGWRFLTGVITVFVVGLTLGFARTARHPVRLIIGPRGVQLVARPATWLPWEVIESIEIADIYGGPQVLVRTPHADRFPTLGSGGVGVRARYLPQLNALSLCPISVLHAPPWQVSHALHSYAGHRMRSP